MPYLTSRILGYSSFSEELRKNFKFWTYFTSAVFFWVATGFAAGGVGWFVGFGRFFLLQSSNGWIFVVTYSMAWFAFATILYARRLLRFKGLVIAGAAPFGGAGLYELVQDVVGLTFQPTIWVFNPIGLLNLTAWVALGLTGIFYWKISKAWLIIAIGFALSWVFWVSLGYQQISWGTFQAYPFGYIFNVVLKIVSFLLFALPLWYDIPGR